MLNEMRIEKGISFVSIIVPCRNEERFVGRCLDSIIANDFPKDRLEVLVIDGMSHDGTRKIVEEYCRKYPYVKLLYNPKKITPCALNIGIRNAAGELILWMSAHNHYKENYISLCVESLHKYGADNVGGIIMNLPRENTLMGQTIAAGLSHRFGVGNSHFRIRTDEPKWVDTVFGGCYRREVFSRIGLFNEELARGQDMEFNLRLKKGGGKILLVPEIISYYYVRSDMKSFLKHNWDNGVWAILPFLYSPIVPISWRHMVPLMFVTALIVTAVLGLLVKPFHWLFLMGMGSYVAANLVVSAQIAFQKKDVRYLIAMPFVFGAFHFGYGAGSLWGIVKILGRRKFWKRLFWNRLDESQE